MADSRVKNSKRNLVSGLIHQVTNICLPFAIKTIILYVLGAQYQGLNGLFSSILQILNLTDLGFSSAVVYILYKPIAEEDNETVCAIIAYLKKIYRYVGMAMVALGLVLCPFLPLLINGGYPNDINIYILFLIYLLNTAVSYWLFAYKSALLTAMQRADIVNNVSTITRTILHVIQIVLLLLFRNYYIYICVLPVLTIANNLLLEYASRKYFPAVLPKGMIPPDTKKDLIKQVKGIFIERIGDVARNGADNIVLSALIGLTAVAIYNNYYYIYSALYGISLVISKALAASIGNSIAMETKEKNYKDLCKFTFIYSWFTGWGTVCLCCLYQPFMIIWMRGNEGLLLPDYDMLLFALYFYVITMNNIRNQYLTGAGLYWELRFWYVLEAIGNIVLNIVLGYFFGITGIIVATLITIFVFNFIVRCNVLFRCYFKFSPKSFYKQHTVYALAMIVGSAITYFITSLVPFAGFIWLFIKAAICMIVPNALFFLLYHKSQLFHETIIFLKSASRRL